MPAPATPIDYATGPQRSPPRWHVRLRRHLIVLSLVAVAGYAVVAAWGPLGKWYAGWVAARQREAQTRLVLTFTMPPDKVVYEEDPELAARLLALPFDPDTAYRGPPLNSPPIAPANRKGDYRRWDGREPYAEYVPRFHESRYGANPIAEGLVFVHERRGHPDRRRSVMVTVARRYGEWGRSGLDLTIWSRPPDGSFPYRNAIRYVINLPLAADEVARLYAGQVDPADPARLTIRYEVDDVPGTVEGKLEADDSVTLRVLDGPAANHWRPVPRP